ncbi:hypothetical protein [Aquipuribacter sp. SD81]|uniref:hypothetical protein n=1 Tax=Aquipuribacter sp. SD81 TaxID=3127703 RepID=UPI003017B0AA
MRGHLGVRLRPRHLTRAVLAGPAALVLVAGLVAIASQDLAPGPRPLATVPLASSTGGPALFPGATLVPGRRESACLVVTTPPGGDHGEVVVQAVDVDGALAEHLRLEIGVGAPGSSCADPPAAVVAADTLSGLATTTTSAAAGGVGTGWVPRTGGDARAFTVRAEVADVQEAAGTSASATLAWSVTAVPGPSPRPTPGPTGTSPTSSGPSSAPAPTAALVPGIDPRSAGDGAGADGPLDGPADRQVPGSDATTGTVGTDEVTGSAPTGDDAVGVGPPGGEPTGGDAVDDGPGDVTSDTDALSDGDGAPPDAAVAGADPPGAPGPLSWLSSGLAATGDALTAVWHGLVSAGAWLAAPALRGWQAVVVPTGLPDAVLTLAAPLVAHPQLPLGMVALMVLFLLVQDQVDRRDPKLALAPLHPETDLPFDPDLDLALDDTGAPATGAAP